MQAKTTYKRFKFDFYPTPPSCVSAIYTYLTEMDSRIFLSYPRNTLKVLDAGAGTGIWGKVLKKQFPMAHLQLWGIDIQNLPALVEYEYWLSGTDFLSEQGSLLLSDGMFDIVLSNPPYKYAEEFVRKSLALTKHGGYVIMLVRLAFLESIKRGTGLFADMPPVRVSVLSRRPSFHQSKKTGSLAYCVIVWKKDNYDATELDWLNWDYLDYWKGLREEARKHLEELGAFDEHLESEK